MKLIIETADNGYIITDIGKLGGGSQKVFTTLEDVFSEFLRMFEGRAETFGGNLFGEVIIHRGKREK